MSASISPQRVATLVGGFDRSPAYAGLADSLRQLIGDGRIALGTQLPSERELTATLSVSRTTVTRAYAALREVGFAEARVGSGTFTRVPSGRTRAFDRALTPRPGDADAIDLSCAATPAPAGVGAAYADAAAELPAYLAGPGYFVAGLPELQQAIAATYDERGLPTDPDQILVTPGALSATSIVAQAFTGPGDRALVETPCYPNAVGAIRHSGARIVSSPVDPTGWDLDATGAVLRQTAPTLAYLIPDFQNPTGHLMTDDQRATLARQLSGTRTIAVVDEAHQALALEGQEMPQPFAHHSPGSITIGSASKTFWGGLRLGWLRAPHEHVERLITARLGLDLGSPVLEQLVLSRLLADRATIVTEHRIHLRAQRDALVGAVRRELPDWTFVVPTGGLALWCELPRAGATDVAIEAERHGVIVTPGPMFAAEGGLDRFVRLPWARPIEELEEAVRRMAAAWHVVTSVGGRRPGPRRGRITVA